MRILLTTPSYPPIVGGLGNAVFEQVCLLRQAGHYVVVATSPVDGLPRSNVPSVAEVKEFNVSGADWCLRPIKGDVDAYTDFLISSDFDVIIMHAWQNWATDLILRNINSIRGRKFIHSHCISTNEFYFQQPFRSTIRYIAWRPYYVALRKNIKKLDGIFFLDDVEQESRFKDLDIAKSLKIKSHFIPNMIPLSTINEMEYYNKGYNERNQLIAVGSYEWQKGFDFVLKAYALSSAKNTVKLKIFGQKFTDFTNFLQELANHLGINDQYIEFREGVTASQLLTEYSKSSLFLMGSHTECQPMVILDANATGTPFVARCTGCIKNMQGGTAVKYVKEMAFSIDKILADIELWQSYSSQGRFAAYNTYNPSIVGQKLLMAIS